MVWGVRTVYGGGCDGALGDRPGFWDGKGGNFCGRRVCLEWAWIWPIGVFLESSFLGLCGGNGFVCRLRCITSPSLSSSETEEPVSATMASIQGVMSEVEEPDQEGKNYAETDKTSDG